MCHRDKLDTFETTQSYGDDININVDGDECNLHTRLQMIIDDDAADDYDPAL